MNIETTNLNKTDNKTSQITKTKQAQDSEKETNFANELKELKKNEKTKEAIEENTVKEEKNNNKIDIQNKDTSKNIDKAIEGLSSIVKELNQSEDKLSGYIKNEETLADKNNMINNDLNIQENKDLLPQMNPNMNFSGNGQPFSSFMNNSSENKNSLAISSAQELAEESAILSTMAENIAIANKNQVLSKTVTNNEGVKKVDTKTGIKIENIVQYDSIIMNQADVEVFATIVEKGEVDLNNLAPKAAEKSIQVSKTLADLLVKSMENNQPVRIDFDNDISIIIRISRDGKIIADFLPSSQVAEAYLKENLPLLRQKFDDNNIEYDSLNQKEHKDPNKEQNRKKDRNNE